MLYWKRLKQQIHVMPISFKSTSGGQKLFMYVLYCLFHNPVNCTIIKLKLTNDTKVGSKQSDPRYAIVQVARGPSQA